MADGRKRAEFRKDDREPRFETGHVLNLRRWSPNTGAYTGQRIAVVVTHTVRGGDVQASPVPEGYVMLSIERMGKVQADEEAGR